MIGRKAMERLDVKGDKWTVGLFAKKWIQREKREEGSTFGESTEI